VIKIKYAGSGNNSQFTYDGYNRCAQLIEQTSDTTTSTKQFVWYGGQRCEARDASGSLLDQYFTMGETLPSGSNFFTFDHQNSIREVTDSAGNLAGRNTYGPYGRASLSVNGLILLTIFITRICVADYYLPPHAHFALAWADG
jgi:uncharacterized protein RhaS with RHS repeats